MSRTVLAEVYASACLWNLFLTISSSSAGSGHRSLHQCPPILDPDHDGQPWHQSLLSSLRAACVKFVASQPPGLVSGGTKCRSKTADRRVVVSRVDLDTSMKISRRALHERRPRPSPARGVSLVRCLRRGKDFHAEQQHRYSANGKSHYVAYGATQLFFSTDANAHCHCPVPTHTILPPGSIHTS